MPLSESVIAWQHEVIQIILLPFNIVSATLFTYSQVHNYLVIDKSFPSSVVYHNVLELKLNQ